MCVVLVIAGGNTANGPVQQRSIAVTNFTSRVLTDDRECVRHRKHTQSTQHRGDLDHFVEQDFESGTKVRRPSLYGLSSCDPSFFFLEITFSEYGGNHHID
jgi:hypothetical protein